MNVSPTTFVNTQPRMESQCNWKAAVGVTTGGVRHCQDSHSPSQVPHTHSSLTPHTVSGPVSCLCLVGHAHRSSRPASVTVGFAGFLIHRWSFLSLRKNKTPHTHVQHYTSTTTSFLPVPYKLFTLWGHIFPLLPLKLRLPCQSFSLQKLHSLFRNWGGSSLPSEAPSHLGSLVLLKYLQMHQLGAHAASRNQIYSLTYLLWKALLSLQNKMPSPYKLVQAHASI